MTVSQFQRIKDIQLTTSDTVEQMGFIVCALFSFNEEYVNERMSRRRFIRYVRRVNRQLTAKPGRFTSTGMLTDATKATFAQFIEMQKWLEGETLTARIVNLDRIAATLSLMRFRKGYNFNAELERMKRRPFVDIINKTDEYILSQNKLITAYSGLFSDDIVLQDDETEEDAEVIRAEERSKTHPFMKQYSWLYSAKQVAVHLDIKLNEVYDIGVVEALNTLAYLKSQQSYEKFINK